MLCHVAISQNDIISSKYDFALQKFHMNKNMAFG